MQGTEILKKRGKELPEALRGEWADVRDAAWTPLRSEADWRCPSGHKYRMTRSLREAMHAAGQVACPKCAKSVKAPPKVSVGTNVPPSEEVWTGTTAPVDRADAPPAGNPGRVQAVCSGGAEWAFEEVPVGRSPSSGGRHHVLVVDRSGSMAGDVASLRETILKLATVEELRGTVVSLVSYSGDGDVRVHARRVRGLDSTHVAGIQATGLTCASGALRAVADLLATEPVGSAVTVTLHSDGYFNDPSPLAERAACEAIVRRELGLAHRVVFDTVAHRTGSDFTFLAKLANLGGGACAQAAGIRELDAALHRACTAAAWRSAPTRVSAGHRPDAPAGCDYALAVDPAARSVTLSASGVAAPAGARAWRVSKRDASDPKATGPGGTRLALALARGLVGLGRVTEAKRVALGQCLGVLRRHARALTGPEVAAFAAELERLVFDASDADLCLRVPPEPAPVGPTLPEALALLAKHACGVRVFYDGLATRYKRRGLKRVPGRWGGGALVAPRVVAAPRRAGAAGSDGWVDVVSVEQNRQSATVNLTVSQPIELVQAAVVPGAVAVGSTRGVRLGEVAGVSLEGLRQYRSFTLIGDGERCLDALPVRVVDRAAHAALRAVFPELAGKFDPAGCATLDLTRFPLVSGGEPEAPSAADVSRVLRLTVLQRLLAASLRGESPTLAPEQVRALAEVHVTPALYFSPPTCYPWPDLKEAQRAGKVDARLRYSVAFGAAGVLGTDDLYGANEYVQRRFVVDRGGSAVEKPSALDLFTRTDAGAARGWVTPKELSKRVKLGPVDDLTMPVYEAVLAATGLPFGPRQRRPLLALCGLAPERDLTDPAQRADLLRTAEDALEEAWAKLRAATYHVGASGEVPESWGPALTAEYVEGRGYSIPKSARDGLFYAFPGGAVAAVYAREALYSPSWEGSRD